MKCKAIVSNKLCCEEGPADTHKTNHVRRYEREGLTKTGYLQPCKK